VLKVVDMVSLDSNGEREPKERAKEKWIHGPITL